MGVELITMSTLIDTCKIFVGTLFEPEIRIDVVPIILSDHLKNPKEMAAFLFGDFVFISHITPF
jgi:hypothetical protein